MEQVTYRFSNQELKLIIANEPVKDDATGIVIFETTEYTHSSWDEYILFSDREKYKSHLNLLRQAIIELEWVGASGSEIANDWYFYFSDGTIIIFTWRSWAEMMAALVGHGESYIKYYC